MQLPTITNKQKEILLLLYRFRFLNRIQIQKLLKHKNPKNTNVWLKDLTTKSYTKRIFEKRAVIYNLDEMKKETEINEALLDYSKDGVLKNDGKSTFFNDKDLSVLCDKGFIKSPVEIYCLTKINPNNIENKVISIDSNTNKKKDVYVSKNLISDFSIINDKLYIGEIDLYTKKSYVLVDELKIEAPTVISLIYQMDDKPYFASLKSELNGNTESHYLIEATALKQQNKRIYLYE